ncbi:hypothetical protein [Archangium sp.]|uniref:hypothetical protein n=1 Tax=Archangium sp. TaxID=1872627 RepID=UPI00389ADCC3
MQDDKAIKLVRQVIAKTREGKINWEQTPSGRSFIAAFEGTYSMIISFTEDEETGNQRAWFGLNDAGGERLLTVDPDTDGITDEELWQLYEMARRRAFKVDEKLDKLLDSLKKL